MKVLQWENYYFKWLSNKIDRLCDLIDPILATLLVEQYCENHIAIPE